MGGARKVSAAILSALTLFLGSCNASDTGKASLDDYVQKECAITVDFKDRLGRLTRDFATNAKDQTALAATVQDIADLYDELIAKDNELGDPPNGEGTSDSDEVERAVVERDFGHAVVELERDRPAGPGIDVAAQSHIAASLRHAVNATQAPARRCRAARRAARTAGECGRRRRKTV